MESSQDFIALPARVAPIDGELIGCDIKMHESDVSRMTGLDHGHSGRPEAQSVVWYPLPAGGMLLLRNTDDNLGISASDRRWGKDASPYLTHTSLGQHRLVGLRIP